MRRLVLASASPARAALLRAAGFAPEVQVSGVDEEFTGPDTAATTRELAVRKARAVAARVPDALVLGCDSLLDLDGAAYGKPASAEAAAASWRARRGRQGTLYTGQCLIDTASGAESTVVGATVVGFSSPSDAEIAAYVATGEPAGVAGGFTLEGRSAPFIDYIEGDALGVLGCSVALLVRQCAELGVALTELWPVDVPRAAP
jgi:septum formation protein